MKTVSVNTPSGRYDVQIGAGLLPSLGSALRGCVRVGRCAVIAGENVFPLYGESACESLREAGFQPCVRVIPAGEQTKCLEQYRALLEFLAAEHFTRSDCVIALGGGVTGDLSGFTAATYQRGIPYIQVPTTLLAAVDSSVGGKTAIDLPQGKNQVGAFYQPALVLCDTDTLATLPERELRAGFAEVIKYAILFDPALFAALRDRTIDLPSVIETCVKLKAAVVAEDERDTGLRRLLNLGHSFGHAVESRSHYALLHGEAVAVGTAMICRAAQNRGLLSRADCEAVIALLAAYGLPTETEYTAAELFDTLLIDKKFSGGKMHLIVPREIGRCEIVAAAPGELRFWLEAGLR